MATKMVMSAQGVAPASCGISASRLLKSHCASPEEKLKSEKSDAECPSLPTSAPQSKSFVETAVKTDGSLSSRVFPPRALHFFGNCADSNDWESTDDEQSPEQTHAKSREGRGKAPQSPHRKDGVRFCRLECTSSASNNSWKAGSVLSPSRRKPLGRKARQRSSRVTASTWRAQKSAAALLPTESTPGSFCNLSNLDSQRNRRMEGPAGEREQRGSVGVGLTKENGKRREKIRHRSRRSPSCPVKSKSAAADEGQCWQEEEDEDFFTDSWGDGLHSHDLLDRLGIFAPDDNFQRRDPDRDSFLLDFEEGLFDSDDASHSLLGDPCEEDYMFSEEASDDYLPLLLRDRPRVRNGPVCRDFEAGGVGSSPSVAAEERDEEEAATYTLVTQMVNTLGVRNWADFLQLQAEYCLFSHAHKQALVTATAAERMLPDQGDHSRAGATRVSDPETQHTDTEAATSASPPQESAPSHTVEQPLAHRGRVQLLAVKMVAACALHQFMRSAQILRKLQPHDFDCLSPPLQAYVDAAVRLLAGRAAPPR